MNGDCKIQFVDSENQLANLFTKPLNKERFNFLKNELGIIDFKSELILEVDYWLDCVSIDCESINWVETAVAVLCADKICVH